ncbi:MAG TPA: zinc ABC transporter substrate-binding protein [Nitrososphaera sp.]|nr:zinc ABC transporter substrate-binding protein [Nitrososphaera sp.]
MDKKIIIGIAAAAAVATIVPLAIMADTQNNVSPEVAGDQKIKVVVSFFPLYDFARQVGGDRAEVTYMVPAGVEPHDWEPTIRQILDAQSADLFIFNGAGLERWAQDIEARFIVDTSSGLELLDGGEEEEEHEGEEKGEEHGAFDPHIWLDPVLAKQQVAKIRDGFVEVDPENAQYYNDNAARLMAELDGLDASIRAGLSDCEKQDFIAFHNAFSYFAKRYGLTQHTVHMGLPEGDVPPQRLQQVVDLANELNLDTIYSEELVDPRLAQIIASEIPNGKVLVLSPIEGLEEEELQAGLGYIDKMEQNLVNLKAGLKCR